MNVRTLAALIAFIMSVALPMAARAYSLDVPPGTDINITIDQTLDSGSAHVGDSFTAHVQPPFPPDEGALENAYVSGEVVRVQKAGQGTKPEIGLAFSRITLPDGSTAPFHASVLVANPKQGKKNVLRIAEYALGGMLLGNMVVKTVFAGSGGGLAGAVGGFLIGNNYKSDISFPAGSTMTVRTRGTVAIRPQAR